MVSWLPRSSQVRSDDTGHEPDQTFRTLGNNRTPFTDDWPFMGTVVAAKRPAHKFLPGAITLPHKPSQAPYTRPGQFAARLGVQHDPLYIHGSVDAPLKFYAPSLELQAGMNVDRLTARRELLGAVDDARRNFDSVAATDTWSRLQERAISSDPGRMPPRGNRPVHPVNGPSNEPYRRLERPARG